MNKEASVIRLVALVIAAGLMVMLEGCGTDLGYSKPLRIQAEEANKHFSGKVLSVEIPVAVIGCRLKTGDTVRFGGPSAAYDRLQQRLIGHGLESDSIAIPLTGTDLIWLRRLDKPLNDSTAVQTMAFFQLAQFNDSVYELGGIRYPLSEELKFAGTGAELDTLRQVIVGKVKGGAVAEIPIDKIARMKVWHYSRGKAALQTGFLLIAIPIVTYYFIRLMAVMIPSNAYGW